MNKLNIYLLLIPIFAGVPASGAITIDGDVSDWGAGGFLSGDWSMESTWVPNEGVRFIVEDNRDPDYGGTYTGVHIVGTGSSYTDYDEPKVVHKDGSIVEELYGGEVYDTEAMYFQQDIDNVYVLIVSSMPEDAVGDDAPGDLRIDVNKTEDSDDGYPYELGVKIGAKTGLSQFDIYDVVDWAEVPDYIPSNLPARIIAGTYIDTANGAYVTCTACNLGTGQDYSITIYIIELEIPKSALGGPGTYNMVDFGVVDNRTTDAIRIPEFAIIALPIAAIIGMMFILTIRRKEL